MAIADNSADLSWDLVRDVRQMFEFHFMVNAFRAGTIVAIVAGLIGWFMVLRRQSYAGHTLSLVGFPGAAGAIWLGVSAAAGYYVFCVATALVIAVVPRVQGRGYSEESAVIGTTQAFALACGFLFVSLYKGFLNGLNAVLFGTFLGITDDQVRVLFLVACAVLLVLLVVGRPLLFASIDPDVAAARGVPTGVLSVVFLLVLALAAAEAAQITGALLVFALLVVPAAAAQALTARPALGLATSVGLALLITWLGLVVGYYSDYPVGFWITSIAFGVYLLAKGAEWLGSRAHDGEAVVP
jgi:zinc/manganese transport system permease protein